MKLTGTKEVWDAAVEVFWTERNAFGKVVFLYAWVFTFVIMAFEVVMDLTKKDTP